MVGMNSLLSIVALASTIIVAPLTTASAQHGSGEPGITSFISAVNSISDEIKALNAEKSCCVHDIHLVDLQKLSNPGNASVLNKAVTRNSGQIALLRDTLKANATVMSALLSGKVSIDQVVALDVQPGIAIYIYYQPGS
jgi:hypothetical protein